MDTVNSEEQKEANQLKNLKPRKKRTSGFEQWGGYMAAKKMKLGAQFQGQKPLELEEPSAEELKRLMLIHGGTYHYYCSSKTTHTVASNLPNSKIKNLKNQIVVTPEWITDSIKAGRLLPHQNYFLYTPEVLNNQPRINANYFKPNAKLGDCSIESSATESGDIFKENSALEVEASCTNPCVILEPNKNNVLNEIIQNDFSSITKNCIATENTEISPSLKSLNYNSDFQADDTNISTQTKTESPLSAELQKNNRLTIKAGHPEFLSEFYSHSRLHHISTAGQDLKRYVQYLIDNHKGKDYPGRIKLKMLCGINDSPLSDSPELFKSENINKNEGSVIMHLDMDCFFVSVGLRKHPELKGCPVAVTHSKGKRGGTQVGSDIHYETAHYANQAKKKIGGLTFPEKVETHSDTSTEKQKISISSKEYGSLSEIASCSYEARKAGIRNGMFLGEALRRCPELKTIAYDFEGYTEVSRQLYDIVSSYTLDIEAVSCDELYIDCTELLMDTKVSPLQFASILRAEINEKTDCTASAGLGSNMLIARLANKYAKPNGQHYVCNEEIEEFMKKQKVQDLPGVGYSTSMKLEHLGVKTCDDLQKWSLSKLQQEFGPKTGQSLFSRCRGKDDRTVQPQKDRKSVSAEINYGIRFETEEEVYNFINELSVEVHNRLQNISCKGKSLTLKIMVRRSDAPLETAKFMGHGVCDNVSKSVILKTATDNPKVIGNECCLLARSLKIKPQDYRGLGIQMSKLETSQKEEKNKIGIQNFLSSNCTALPDDKNGDLKQEIFSPKKLDVVDKSTPHEGTIKHFLTNKPSPQKKLSYQPVSITPDQLDKSVLDALPDEIRKEVLEACGISMPVASYTLSQPTSAHNVKTKVNKPKRKMNPHSSRKKLNPGASSSQNKSNSTIKTCLVESAARKTHPQITTAKETKKANLGGAVEINEVRTLIKEWIHSTEVPLEDDVNTSENIY
ncbi:DNA repair protein REV1-like isoform X2 [Stegodyphus dumicola]|uniref:DNA repair protein REV1-like isoform X2 n=1 Tax=Stegodyphus dumicola TaxID=202533 RepID=UPI0015ACA6D9|nr:DNA repair protein REV1-like isoform X2 [Stegodyphus dumicola]